MKTQVTDRGSVLWSSPVGDEVRSVDHLDLRTSQSSPAFQRRYVSVPGLGPTLQQHSCNYNNSHNHAL